MSFKYWHNFSRRILHILHGIFWLCNLGALLLFTIFAQSALANFSEVKPSPYMYVVSIITVLFGGICALLGILVTMKGIGKNRGSVKLPLPGIGQMELQGLGQGAIVTLFGCLVLVISLYFLQERTEAKYREVSPQGEIMED